VTAAHKHIRASIGNGQTLFRDDWKAISKNGGATDIVGEAATAGRSILRRILSTNPRIRVVRSVSAKTFAGTPALEGRSGVPDWSEG
jgi:hypothetical protein